MKRIETKDVLEMSQLASDLLVDALKEKPNSLFCIATGGSPTETYRLFVEKVKAEQLDTSQLRILGLDEWCGLEENHPATCEYYIRKHLLEPLAIPDERFLHFHTSAKDANAECLRMEEILITNKGIDLCLLGIGKNGHLGLNEPNDSLTPFIHKATLDKKTQTHSMLLENEQSATTGYTLGIKNLLDSRKIILLITGSDKKEAYQQLLTEQISSMHPANYLWLHNNTDCFIDLSAVL